MSQELDPSWGHLEDGLVEEVVGVEPRAWTRKALDEVRKDGVRNGIRYPPRRLELEHYHVEDDRQQDPEQDPDAGAPPGLGEHGIVGSFGIKRR